MTPESVKLLWLIKQESFLIVDMNHVYLQMLNVP